MTNYPISGGCFCGDMRYEISGRPLSSGNCHCRSCRRTAGAQSVAWAVVPAEHFRFLGKSPVEFASSPGVTRTFCGRCGTSLTFQNGTETIDVTLASLDDPEQLPPTKESWLSHRLSWAPVDRTLKLEDGDGEGGPSESERV